MNTFNKIAAERRLRMNAKNNGKNKRKAATARELQFLLILRSGERDRIDRMIDGIREKLDRLGEEAWVPE